VSDKTPSGILSSTNTRLAGVENSAGTYTWNVPTSLQSFATYGFTIIKDTDTTCFQYSFPFHITGLAGSSSSGSASKSGPASTVTMHLSTGSNYVASTSTVSNTTTSYPTAKPTSNYTLATTLASQTSASNTQASSTSATSSSATATTSKSAAAAQIASGSLAMIGGFVLALAL